MLISPQQPSPLPLRHNVVSNSSDFPMWRTPCQPHFGGPGLLRPSSGLRSMLGSTKSRLQHSFPQMSGSVLAAGRGAARRFSGAKAKRSAEDLLQGCILSAVLLVGCCTISIQARWRVQEESIRRCPQWWECTWLKAPGLQLGRIQAAQAHLGTAVPTLLGVHNPMSPKQDPSPAHPTSPQGRQLKHMSTTNTKIHLQWKF